MPIKTEIWRVGHPPALLSPSWLETEQQLEDMIVAAPRILSEDWMLIGRQEDTGYGGRIDLLAIAPDGSLVLIELKRGRTPREVVAQALDYAAWVEHLTSSDIASIYRRFTMGRDLDTDFSRRFGATLDPESLNSSHQIIIVSASIDDSTERIVDYLSKREIPINVLCFQIHELGGEKLLSRAWLIDPSHTQISAAVNPERANEPWNGEFYISFGDDFNRNWDDAVKYGFISAGGGRWYTQTLRSLSPGDRIWVNVPGRGYVGVGRVTGYTQPISEFRVLTESGEVAAREVLTANYHHQNDGDSERCEYFVAVHWLQTVPLSHAIRETGMFGNQNTVCKPTTASWRSTVDRLKEKLPNWDSDSGEIV